MGGVESHCHSLLVWTIPQNAVFEQDRDHDRDRETADLIIVTLFCGGFQVRGSRSLSESPHFTPTVNETPLGTVGVATCSAFTVKESKPAFK